VNHHFLELTQKGSKNTKGTKDVVSLMMLLTCGSTTWRSFLANSDAHGTNILRLWHAGTVEDYL